MTKSRLPKRPLAVLIAAIASIPAAALAVQTYTDSTGDYAGGSPTAPPPGDSYVDISHVIVTNNATNILFQIDLAPSDGGHTTDITTDMTQSYGKYQIGLETIPGAGSTAVSNPYSPIGISTGMNYWIDSWTNQTTGGTVASPDTGDAQVFNYAAGAWTQVAGNGLYNDMPGNPQFTQTSLSVISVTTSVSLAALGLSAGSKFNFDVWTTFDEGDGAVDALDSGAAATSESSGTYINAYAPTPYDSATAPGSTYSTTTYTVINPAFYWDNFPMSVGGDGVTWDVGTPYSDSADYNWNDGLYADQYTDGSDVTFNDVNGGNYAVTLSSTVSPNSIVFNNSAGNYVISGSGSIAGTGSLTKMGTSTVTLSTVNTYSGGTTVSNGKLVIGVHGALPDHSLTITGGAVQLALGTGLAQVTSLSISGTGVLDITNNHMILAYAPGTRTTVDAAIRGYLITGRNGGAWNGTAGIISSAVVPSSGYALGYADGADGAVVGLSSGQIEIKYTLLGDADLDGSVTGVDFTILASNLNKSGRVWDQGDFDYDGSVTGVDFTDLVTNLGESATGADVVLPAADYAAIDAFAAANGLMADVPEPASAALLVIAGMGVLARRRRPV